MRLILNIIDKRMLECGVGVGVGDHWERGSGGAGPGYLPEPAPQSRPDPGRDPTPDLSTHQIIASSTTAIRDIFYE